MDRYLGTSFWISLSDEVSLPAFKDGPFGWGLIVPPRCRSLVYEKCLANPLKTRTRSRRILSTSTLQHRYNRVTRSSSWVDQIRLQESPMPCSTLLVHKYMHFVQSISTGLTHCSR